LRLLFPLILIFSLSASCFAKSKHSYPPVMKANTVWLRKELNKIGLSQGFIKEVLEAYEPQSFDKTLTLNLLGFLNPPGQHMNRVTPESMYESQHFIQENKKTFNVARNKFHVDPEVISALLWIETRHGEDMGNFHTASVYLHLLQADLKNNKSEIIKRALVKNQAEEEYTAKALRKKMAERTKKKALWAKEQLLALATARKKVHLDLKTLRGSYAGAFGLPQFIPTSYLDYAQSMDASTPDLLSYEDAILSVAHYLAEKGWDNNQDEAKISALMKYNNSEDYANSIIAISKGIGPGARGSKTGRVPSSDAGE
jgi:membrane-bound lytic murein transglycosylase B